MKGDSMRVQVRLDSIPEKSIRAEIAVDCAPHEFRKVFAPFVNSGMRGSTCASTEFSPTQLWRARILRSHFTGASLSPPIVVASGISRP